MAHLQFMPGDPRLVDQLVCELKSKGIFDQFRKDCIADVDTRPAYQNLRQRVESSVSSFLARQCWQPDLNKNQLREKLRKHILDGNYLEQGVERIVDQVVNPKVATVFIPQVEDLVYNYLGITRKKSTPKAETSNGKIEKEDLLPTDLEAVSPGSVRSNEEKSESMDIEVVDDESKMEIDDEKSKEESKEESILEVDKDKECADSQMSSGISELTENNSEITVEISAIPLPDEIKLEDIPLPDNSPPTADSKKIDVDKIQLPKEFNLHAIPMPKYELDVKDENSKAELNSDNDDSSSDSSLIRNMSPLTPIRNYNNENSCDAHQGFDDSNDAKNDDENDPSSFRFTIESKSLETSPEIKPEEEKKDPEQVNLSYQFNNQVNINPNNHFNTPTFDDSSNSHNLQIDYESDANSKLNQEVVKVEDKNVEEVKKEVKSEVKNEEKRPSHKSSHRSRDSTRHSSSSKDRSSRRSDSKHSKDSKDKRSSKDDGRKRSSHRERSKDRSDRKESRDSSKHSSHKSSSHRDSKSHRSSSSSQQKSSNKSEDKKSSSSSSSRDKSSRSDKSSDQKSSRDYKSKESSSKSHKSDKDRDRKSSSSGKSKNDGKDKEKKEKKDADDHYRLSGRGSNSRRSTDRDSNDGSSSSKGSNNQNNAKTSDNNKRTNKSNNKSDNTSSSDNTSPSEKDIVLNEAKNDKVNLQTKPIVRVDTHLEVPKTAPARPPFVPDVTIKKPKFAANMEEAKQLMRMRKFLDDEQKRMNQEAALLLEFQANVRPNLSQVYSSVPGPELEFACGNNSEESNEITNDVPVENDDKKGTVKSTEQLQESIENIQNHIMQTDNCDAVNTNTADDNETKTSKFVTQNTESLQEMLSQEVDDKAVKLETMQPEDIKTDKSIEMLPDKIVYKQEATKQENQIEDTKQEFEITIITEELSESEDNKCEAQAEINKVIDVFTHPDENPLNFFTESEKYSAEVKKGEYAEFLKKFIDRTSTCNKMYLMNCNNYDEKTIKEASKEFGKFEIVNYHRNGHLKHNKNLVKNLNISNEVTLPIDTNKAKSLLFSPVKSECSFELSSEYDAKLEEMVNKTSRKEIMEIILGGGQPDDKIEMPRIDYTMDSNIESEDVGLKRKINEVDGGENNNQQVLTANKIRKLSGSDQISSTTEEADQTASTKTPKVIRSKYLGKAKRVGLPRPKKPNLQNSPSSDKSVENYEQNTQSPSVPNGKLKQRHKVQQRYDTSDLYKPKLHFLSRRNNIGSEN